ncbi:hypothetical protein CSW98_14985 [Vibrio sp. HA2012]|nr:hypothetical protein CSW98_14985 [Vibrio sp. HA2012]
MFFIFIYTFRTFAIHLYNNCRIHELVFHVYSLIVFSSDSGQGFFFFTLVPIFDNGFDMKKLME